MHLSGIHVYPIKSCRGLSPDAWEVDKFGLRHDRRWMLINQAGLFLTQRTHRRLALVHVSIETDQLRVESEGMPPLHVALRPATGTQFPVRVWLDVTAATCPFPHADRWFTEFLDEPVRLGYMPDEVMRPVDPYYAPAGGQASFADGFPFLVVGQASLDDLNRRLVAPLPMNRFRPNLVVSGSEPFAEDGWRSVRIGPLPFEVVKPCARCVVTTTDQDTAMIGKEPLRTLATFRRVGNDVRFGMNAVHYGTGMLTLGDRVALGADQ
jgi:uncharacterized protein YcbX